MLNGADKQELELLDSSQMELEMLRAFYLNWVRLHSTDRKDEDALKEASYNLVESAHVVADFRKGIFQ